MTLLYEFPPLVAKFEDIKRTCRVPETIGFLQWVALTLVPGLHKDPPALVSPSAQAQSSFFTKLCLKLPPPTQSFA